MTDPTARRTSRSTPSSSPRARSAATARSTPSRSRAASAAAATARARPGLPGRQDAGRHRRRARPRHRRRTPADHPASRHRDARRGGPSGPPRRLDSHEASHGADASMGVSGGTDQPSPRRPTDARTHPTRPAGTADDRPGDPAHLADPAAHRLEDAPLGSAQCSRSPSPPPVLASGTTAVLVDRPAVTRRPYPPRRPRRAPRPDRLVTVAAAADLTDVVAAATPSVVTITADVSREGRLHAVLGARDRRRVGDHPERRRLHPDEPPRRRGQHARSRSSSRTARSTMRRRRGLGRPGPRAHQDRGHRPDAGADRASDGAARSARPRSPSAARSGRSPRP